MALLGPPLAAHGYDVIFPLMAGHGNKIVFQEDSPNYLWGFLGLTVGLIILSVLMCCRVCPCARLCDRKNGGERCCGGHRKRTRCIYTSCILAFILVVAGAVAWGLGATSGAVFCFSLSLTDGVGPGCGGQSEYNDNLPLNASGYHAVIDEINDMMRIAPGEKVVTGLSGGGGAAIYASMATFQCSGCATKALYSRLLTVAPYIDVAIIGPALSPSIALGLGELKVDFGRDCRVSRRRAGKAGYCNYRLNRIDAMRQVGQQALSELEVPPGLSVETVKVQGDGTVTNKDISELIVKYEELAPDRTASCVLTHVDSRHSPLGPWNYIHTDGSTGMPFTEELICQIVQFLVNGTPMPRDGTTTATETEPAEDICHSVCDSFCDEMCQQAKCTFDCRRQSFLRCGGVPTSTIRS